jgi:hypothetical protein
VSVVVVVLLVLAGLSEAVGRILPLVARRPNVSRTPVVRLLTAGALIDGAVFALWPLSAGALAGLVFPASAHDAAALSWTPTLLAPLLFSAILAFPLLGPLLHLLLFVGVGAGLSTSLATATSLDWWVAAGCVAVAGAALGLAVEGVRRLVIRIGATRAQEVSA